MTSTTEFGPLQAAENTTVIALYDIAGTTQYARERSVVPEATPLERLTSLAAIARELDSITADAVRAAVKNGASWTDIGKAYAVSKQTAWNRWGRDPDLREFRVTSTPTSVGGNPAGMGQPGPR